MKILLALLLTSFTALAQTNIVTPFSITKVNGSNYWGFIYASYATYKPASAWGYTPTGSLHTATCASTNWVEYIGQFGDNGHGLGKVTLTSTPSPLYRFTVYSAGTLTTNSTLQLVGFRP